MCDSRYKLYFNLTTISLVFAVILLSIGAVMFRSNRIAKDTHQENTCKVISSSYYESTCGGGVRFGRSGPCFIPVWMVTYSIIEEMPINASIEKDAYFSTEEAQDKLDQYQVFVYAGGVKMECGFITSGHLTFNTNINKMLGRELFLNSEHLPIGMSYVCWCSVIDPSMARWNKPNTFPGMMLVIFGSILAAAFFVGIYFTYGECKKINFNY